MTNSVLNSPPATTSKPTTPTAEQAGAAPNRLLGSQGPLRMFAPTYFSGSIAYDSPTGFAGSYFCDACSLPCDGVFHVTGKWICDDCKWSSAPKIGRRKGEYPEAPADENKIVQKFAARHKLKLHTDEDSIRVIDGNYGQIFEYDPATLGVMYSAATSTWPRRRRSGEAVGMVVSQDGDKEGVLSFNPEKPSQVKVAIGIAGCKCKIARSTKQKESLAKARSRSPHGRGRPPIAGAVSVRHGKAS
jgi:hypothetical protein